MSTPLPVLNKATDKFKELGKSGLIQYSGYLQEEYIRDLQGTRGAKTYREMADTSPISGILWRMKLAFQGVALRVDPFEEGDEEDKVRAERLWDALNDMEHSLDSTMSEVWSMLEFGYAPMEKTWKACRGYRKDPLKSSKYDDGVISWAAMSLRGQESVDHWEFDDSDRATALVQWPPNGTAAITIPLDKLYLFRTQTLKNNPEGRSLLRGVYWNWYVWKKLVLIAAIQAERDAVGVPVMYVPARVVSGYDAGDSAASAVMTRARKIVENLRWDEQAGIVVPLEYDSVTKQPLYKLELLASPGAKTVNILEQIQHQEKLIAMGLISDSMLLGHEKVGSFSLADSKTSMEAKALGALLDNVIATFNRDVIPDFFRMNGWPMDRLCTLCHGDFETQDLTELGNFIKALSDTGLSVWPNKALHEHFFEAAGIPMPTEEEMEENMEPMPPTVPQPPPPPPPGTEPPEEPPDDTEEPPDEDEPPEE